MVRVQCAVDDGRYHRQGLSMFDVDGMLSIASWGKSEAVEWNGTNGVWVRWSDGGIDGEG